MKLCQKCALEVMKSVKDTGVVLEAPANAIYCPESECEFWVHRVYNNYVETVRLFHEENN